MSGRVAMPSSSILPADVAAATLERMMIVSMLALVGVLVLWELWLAPLRPGGSWLALKALPLALAIPGLFAKRIYTRQWLTLLLPLYIAEGIVRGWSEPGRVRILGATEVVLALAAFAATLAVLRRRRRTRSDR